MKKILSIVSILLLLFAGSLLAADSTHRSGTNYSHQNGERWVVGGSLDVESGGEIDVESGGSLKLAGTALTATAAEINKLASIGTGDILTSTNTKTVENKTFASAVISGGTFTGTLSGGTFTGGTHTSPTINGATLTGTLSGGTFTNGTHTAPILNSPYATYGVTAHAISALEDWVMSTAEEATTYLIVSSGSGTASTVNIKGTATQGQRFVVRNASNNSVIILKSGGTGVTIASGKTAAVFAYGSDYLRETADATH
jgi:hypothetical protein